MTTFADTEPFLKRLYERIDYAPEPRDASLREILGLWRDARQGELVPPVSACRIDELGAAQAAFFMFGRRGPRDFTVLDAGSQAAAFLGLDLHTRPSPIPANRRAAVRMRRLLAEVDRAGEPVLVAFTARNHAREAIHVEMIAAPVTLPNGGRALIGGVAIAPSRAAGERQTRSSPQTPRLRLFALGEDRALGDAVASALGISLAAHCEPASSTAKSRGPRCPNMKNAACAAPSSSIRQAETGGTSSPCRASRQKSRMSRSAASRGWGA
jgi:ribose-phosphate pyrophosphokinase